MLNGINNYLKNNIELIVIFILALIIRVIGLNWFSLSNDELSALSRVQYDNISDVINKGVLIDFHPAGVQVFLYYYIKLFGDSEFALRLPFAIMGTFAVALTYIIGNKWFGKFTAVCASLYVCLLEFPLLYSQIERPYASGLFFSLLIVFAWHKILFDKERKLLFSIIYALSTALCMYNHYFSFLFAILVGATGLFFLNKENYKYYLLAPVVSVLLFSPHITLSISQISKGGLSDWLGKPENNAFAMYLYNCANKSVLIISIFLITFFITIILNFKNKKFNKFHLICTLWFLIPFAIAYYYSIYVNPVLQHSIMLFSFPFLPLFLFSFNIDKYRYVYITVLAVILSYSTFISNNYYKTQHLSEFRRLAESIKETKPQNNSYTAIGTFNNPFYMDYYFKKFGLDFKFDIDLIEGMTDIKKCDSIVNASGNEVCYYVWSCRNNFPDIENIIRQKFPEKVRRESYFMEDYKISEFSLFKKGNDNRTILNETYANFIKPGSGWEIDKKYTDSAQNLFNFTDKNEYGLVFNSTIKEFLSSNKTTLIISGNMSADTKNEALIVFTVENDSGNVFWDSRPINLFYNSKNKKTPFHYVAAFVNKFQENDRIKIFIWNKDKQNFNIFNFNIKLYQKD